MNVRWSMAVATSVVVLVLSATSANCLAQRQGPAALREKIDVQADV